MLEITNEDRWPGELKPGGDGFDRVDFPSWWARHAQRLAHLEPRIVEQWVHRHWGFSPFMFLDLDRLSWRLESWPGEQIIQQVHARWDQIEPTWDYRVFIGDKTPTGRPFEATGTWDFPIVVLETPAGIREHEDERPEVRLLLIEGHLRRRCLNAMMVHGHVAEKHEVFVMTSSEERSFL